MNKLDISVITEKDLENYKTLRLNSLKDSPDAFGSTYDREICFSLEEWKSRILIGENTLQLLPIMAKYEDDLVGLAFGVVNKQEPLSAHIYQMWVSPSNRGKGVGHCLLETLITWGNELQLKNLLLAVNTTNVKAIKFYQSHGFETYGEIEPLREGSQLKVQSMVLKL